MKRIAIIFLFSFVVSGCKKGSDEVTPQAIPDNPLDASQQLILDNVPADSVTLEDMMLPDGTSVAAFLNAYDPTFLSTLKAGRVAGTTLTPKNQKQLLITRMLASANFLVNRSNFPKQKNGLAYVFNGKDFTEPTKPVGDCSSDKLYGLDCSGFMYQLAKSASVNIPSGSAATQGDTALWNKAFSESADYKKVTTKRFDNLDVSKIISGDFIYIKNGEGVVSHTGIALTDPASNRLKFFQSNGTSNSADNGCQKNQSRSRGPRFMNLSIANFKSFGPAYYVIRPITSPFDTYTLHLRCTGQSSDNLILDVLLAPNGLQVEGIGLGRYTGGDSVAVSLSGTYDPVANSIQGNFTVADLELGTIDASSPLYAQKLKSFVRFDIFSLNLNMDDSDYVTLTLDPDFYDQDDVDITPCVGEIRLVYKK